MYWKIRRKSEGENVQVKSNVERKMTIEVREDLLFTLIIPMKLAAIVTASY